MGSVIIGFYFLCHITDEIAYSLCKGFSEFPCSAVLLDDIVAAHASFMHANWDRARWLAFLPIYRFTPAGIRSLTEHDAG